MISFSKDNIEPKSCRRICELKISPPLKFVKFQARPKEWERWKEEEETEKQHGSQHLILDFLPQMCPYAHGYMSP